MRVAVTGADGFTGRYLVPELIRRGHAVTALDVDVTDGAALAAAVASSRPDAVIHLAALAFVHEKDFGPFFAVNQVGSFHLLQALADHRPGSRVLLASTAQVYGAQAQGLLDEAQPTLPANHYALSKLAMEIGSRFWTDRLQVTIVRPFNYTGVGQEARYLVPKIVDHFRRRATTIELGNIDVKRDFGDVRSVVDAYAALLEVETGPSPEPAVYNIATGETESVRGVIARLERLTGHAMKISVNPDFVRAHDVPVLGGRTDRLRAAAPAWRPRPLDETLAWMLDAA